MKSRGSLGNTLKTYIQAKTGKSRRNKILNAFSQPKLKQEITII
jgi:hypothetical protein